MELNYKKFNEALLNWYDLHGRNDLPWQLPRSPYRVWVSEIMLQQTQVKTVIDYFIRFIDVFPDIMTLAEAHEDEVLVLWAGLGYYSRARSLHKTAQIIVNDYAGNFPKDHSKLIALPGIGPSTAAAILSLAFNQHKAILDGNVKRVLSRYFLIEGLPNSRSTEQKLWDLAQNCMCHERCRDYSQAIMDMGATCCTPKKPRCLSCPLQKHCGAWQQQIVDQFPAKKKKLDLPHKQQQFLLFHTKNKIYLEKRPSIGIWGGLWSLPQFDLELDPKHIAEKRFHLNVLKQYELISFKHTFSHFKLELTAIAMNCHLNATALAETPGRWFSREQIKTLGLPKPITQIIDYFYGI